MSILDRIYKKSDSVVFRKIGEECILVPIRRGAGDLDSIYTLNETASFIWNLVDGQRSVNDIKVALIEEFDVRPERAERDLVEHLKALEEIRIVFEENNHDDS